MLSRFVSLATLAAVVLSLAGCGLIFNGNRQSIQVQSSPAGAKVASNPVTGDYTTPTTLNLERKSSYTLTFTKDGYSSATFQIQNHTRGGIVVLDVLLTGLVGVVVDAATGAWDALSPEAATVSLTKVAAVEGPDTITVGLSVGAAANENRLNVEPSAGGVHMTVARSAAH
jgi:hypothetical protein